MLFSVFPQGLSEMWKGGEEIHYTHSSTQLCTIDKMKNEDMYNKYQRRTKIQQKQNTKNTEYLNCCVFCIRIVRNGKRRKDCSPLHTLIHTPIVVHFCWEQEQKIQICMKYNITNRNYKITRKKTENTKLQTIQKYRQCKITDNTKLQKIQKYKLQINTNKKLGCDHNHDHNLVFYFIFLSFCSLMMTMTMTMTMREMWAH